LIPNKLFIVFLLFLLIQ